MLSALRCAAAGRLLLAGRRPVFAAGAACGLALRGRARLRAGFARLRATWRALALPSRGFARPAARLSTRRLRRRRLGVGFHRPVFAGGGWLERRLGGRAWRGSLAGGADRGARRRGRALASADIRTRSKPSSDGRYVQIFADLRLIRLAEPAGRVVAADRHVQMERHTRARRKVHPLRHRLEIVDRLARLDLDDARELAAVGQDEVREERQRYRS